MKSAVTVFAPATIANVGVGFDIMGFALHGLGETATVERLDGRAEVVMAPVSGYADLPSDARENTGGAGLVALIKDHGLNFGFRVTLKKSIPIGSGLGGSSTSAVASVVAANQFLKKQLDLEGLLHYALLGEEVASRSRHCDNIAPCLLGGMVYVRDLSEMHQIPTPKAMRCVVLLPRLTVHTKEARAILKPHVPLSAMVEQTANLTGFVLGSISGNWTLLGQSLRDVVIEPQRAHLIPHFYDLQKAAVQAGALGCSIAGSGPAVFALVKGDVVAGRVRRALLQCAKKNQLAAVGCWISPISAKGASVIRKKGSR